MHEVSFFFSALNILPEHICVIDVKGNIKFVNQSWIEFEINNSSSKPTDWYKINYFNICKVSQANSTDDISHLLEGIYAVANNEISSFTFEYPCHSPDTQRWFSLKCRAFEHNQETYTLLQHVNITKQKKADINSNIDALTGISNRRAFNVFFQKEWLRCIRSVSPISMIIIDIDDFKLFNDTFGHVKGDWCLKLIANELNKLVRRPSDLFCRYGGEEFTYILGNTTSTQALDICNKVHQSLRQLNIKNNRTNDSSQITVSIGVACIQPNNLIDKNMLIEYADQYLYEAKAQGKNSTKFHCCNSEICTPNNCSYKF